MMLRWFAVIAAAGAVMITATVARAQYGQDYYRSQIDRPGPNRGDTIYGTPRSDFPGAKQSGTSARHSKKHTSGAAK